MLSQISVGNGPFPLDPQCKASLCNVRQAKTPEISLELYDVIQAKFDTIPFTPSYREIWRRVSPRPMLLDLQTYKKFAEISSCVIAGVRAVVSQWPHSELLQQLLPVHPRIKSILLKAPTHYHVGTLRPDVLLGADGSLHVCEINARFPLNGYLVTALANEAIQSYAMEPSSFLAKNQTSAISSLFSFLPDLKKRLQKDEVDTVWIINSNEEGHDVTLLEAVIDVTVRRCDPSSLASCPERLGLYFKEENSTLTEIRSCVLELEQEEFLQLDDGVLNAIAELSFKGGTLNDLRSIFLAHDKKMLYVLRSDDYMIDAHNRELLRKYIIPTIIPKEAALSYSGLKEGSLVLKPSLLGKGVGIIMQKNMSDREFLRVTSESLLQADYVMQTYVKQKKCEIMKVNGDVELLNTVAIVNTFDGKFYGTGVFRSNNEDTISMSYGGIASFAVLPVCKIPARARSVCPTLQAADTQKILTSLVRDGVALIGVKHSLHDKARLLSFLKEGLGARCRTHSDVAGEVWDIRPAKNWTLSHARSHTTRPFEIHTDASFELDPPEFVAMSVLHADRNGGGLFSLAKISDAVNRLSQDDVNTLLNVRPRWEVPPEFYRSESGDTFAPVLITRDRARFRRDKLGVDHLTPTEAGKFQLAFKNFCDMLELEMSEGFLVPEGTVIIIDNQKYAHARTEVTDTERHLHRVRFDLPDLRNVRGYA